MKYHYQQGITEKDKKGHKKIWAAFFIAIGVVTYSGFSFATLALNGWPLEPIDNTAKLVKNTKPDSKAGHLFIPAINLTASFSNSLIKSGDPENGTVTIKGAQLGLSVTPASLRDSSPFFNLDKLKEGDEIFLDNAQTRYVYRIGNAQNDNNKKLVLENKDKKLIAEAIGTIAWNGGRAELRPL